MKKKIFSPTEEKVLKLIGRKKISIKQLSEKVYGDEKGPLNRRNTIAGVVSRINKKVVYHDLPWMIHGEGSGRAGKRVWKGASRRSDV